MVKLLISSLRHCNLAMFGRKFLLVKVETVWMVTPSSRWMPYEHDPLMLMCLLFQYILHSRFLCSINLSSDHSHTEQNPSYPKSLSPPIQKPMFCQFFSVSSKWPEHRLQLYCHAFYICFSSLLLCLLNLSLLLPFSSLLPIRFNLKQLVEG